MGRAVTSSSFFLLQVLLSHHRKCDRYAAQTRQRPLCEKQRPHLRCNRSLTKQQAVKVHSHNLLLPARNPVRQEYLSFHEHAKRRDCMLMVNYSRSDCIVYANSWCVSLRYLAHITLRGIFSRLASLINWHDI